MKIAPINEAEVKKELAENPAPQPHVQLQAAVVPPPNALAQVPESTTDTTQPAGPAIDDPRIGDAQGLRLYALVMIILSGVSLLGAVGSVQLLIHAPALLSFAQVVDIITTILPLAGGIYLLVGKSKLVISAVLIVLGIAFAGNLISLLAYAQFVFALIVYSPISILNLSLPIGMFVWTIMVFRRVQRV
jgi:hypothetical protein